MIPSSSENKAMQPRRTKKRRLLADMDAPATTDGDGIVTREIDIAPHSGEPSATAEQIAARAGAWERR